MTTQFTSFLVSVIDDDESVRQSLPGLLRQLGCIAEAFESASTFLSSGAAHRAECLVLDVAMPGMSGPELQLELKRRGMETPIVFITGGADDELRKELLARGAIECLFKPFSEEALLIALRAAHRGR